MVRIRREQSQDRNAIREVNIRTFDRTLEADIVDKLRRNCNDLLSLVAVKQSEVVGHIAFGPAIVENKDRTIREMGLAPMAVLPGYQLQEIGSKLSQTGVARLRSRRCQFVIALSHHQYYPRFGFEPASHYGIRSEWQVSNEAFMKLVLNESEMRGISGMVRYRPEFAEEVSVTEPRGSTDRRSPCCPPTMRIPPIPPS